MRWYCAGIGICLPIVLLCGCGRAGDPRKADPRPAPVHAVAARVGRISPALTLSGFIAPLQNVAISSALQEPADAVYVREGDSVSAGQTLAVLDTADLRANYASAERTAAEAQAKVAQARDQGTLNIQQGRGDLASAQSQLAQAQQKASLSRVTLSRDRQLYAQGFLARQVLDNDTTQYQSDEQAVASARAAVETAAVTVGVNGNDSRGLQQDNLRSAQASAASAQAQAQQIAVQISKATIVSPVDGVVVNRNINVGQYPGSAQIFTVQQVGTVYAMLNASGDQLFLVHPGAAAQVSLPNVPTKRMPGVVEAVLGQAEPGTTNFVVKVRLANPGRILQSGMVVTARIALGAVTGVMIPTSAFVDATHDAVRTVGRNGTITVATVRDVAEQGSYSIVEGLNPNARVVVQAQ